MMDLALRELTVRDLLPAQALLTTALPYDRSDVVTAEKLLASNFRRDRFSVGAFSPDGELLGVMALAGRWIKLLAVKPAVQRRGIGSVLLRAAKEHLAQTTGTATGAATKLRVGDHPGNYLSPGLDERNLTGQAFVLARGFGEATRLLNPRAPVRDNPLITE